MFKLARIAALLLFVALTFAEPRVAQQQEQQLDAIGTKGNHPFLFLSTPRGRANAKQVGQNGFQVIAEAAEVYDDEDVAAQLDDEELEDDDDEEERNASSLEYDEDDEDNLQDDEDDEDDNAANDADDDDDVHTNVAHVRLHSHVPHSPSRMNLRSQLHQSGAERPNFQLVLKNAKSTHMMVSREHAGAIMVPDGVIEIEGQSVIDEKTGKAALLVPRAALDAIPDGSVVALMERSLDATEQERANRVYVRRRRKGSRRNVRRRGGKRRRRGGKRRRRGGKGNNVRVYTVGGNRRRRRGGVRRGGRPTVIQG